MGPGQYVNEGLIAHLLRSNIAAACGRSTHVHYAQVGRVEDQGTEVA